MILVMIGLDTYCPLRQELQYLLGIKFTVSHENVYIVFDINPSSLRKINNSTLTFEKDFSLAFVGFSVWNIKLALSGLFVWFSSAAQKAKLSHVEPLTLNVWAGLSGAVVSVFISAGTEDMRFSSETDDIIFVGMFAHFKIHSYLAKSKNS